MQPAPNIPGLTAQTSAAIVSFCIKHRVRALRLYGSIIRDELTPESDIDILLEFQPGIDPDLFELGGMQQELSDIFDRDVDLKTPEMFSARNLQRVLASSVLAFPFGQRPRGWRVAERVWRFSATLRERYPDCKAMKDWETIYEVPRILNDVTSCAPPGRSV